MHQERVNKVLDLMAQKNLTQMIISDPSAIFYLTGTWIQPGERLLALYLTQTGKHKLFVMIDKLDFIIKKGTKLLNGVNSVSNCSVE